MVGGRIVSFCILLATAGCCLAVVDGNELETTGSLGNGGSGGSGGSGGQTTGSSTDPRCQPPCSANATCNPANNTCNCYAGYRACPSGDGRGAACVQTNLDSNNCGGCGNVCGYGESCLGGECTCHLTICPLDGGGSVCVDPESDSANCGQCGRACPGDGGCSLGGCE